MSAGDKVLLNFPAGNRDPAKFDQADEVIIDRQKNRPFAFGIGIHRCLGSNVARMEMSVALETWLERFPTFALTPGADVRWGFAGLAKCPSRCIPDKPVGTVCAGRRQLGAGNVDL